MTQGLLPGHPAARALVDWLAIGEPLPWRLHARLSWNAFWFERLLRAQRPHAMAVPPAFVMGFWRSGTTLLHNLLYERYVCTAPLTWQCFAPASFTFQRPPMRDASARRPMDDGVVHLFGPQEDEFALLLLGEPSLYRGFLDPARLDVIADACLGDDMPELSRWKAFVAAVASDEAPLLLKSPNHVFRLPAIVSAWPDGRMIWIYRPFAEVLASNLRMWRAMMDLHRLRTGEPDLPAFLERTATRYRDIVTRWIEAPAVPTLWLNYGDLSAAPDAVSATAARFLGLSPRSTQLEGIDADVHPSRTAPQSPLPGTRLQILADEIDRLHAVAAARQQKLDG